ncbi:MAG: histidine kinase, partial [Bacteroidota bacterium]
EYVVLYDQYQNYNVNALRTGWILIVNNLGPPRFPFLGLLLRYSIQLNHAERVTLEKEIEVVQDYLQLESIQYEERLHYSFDIDHKVLHIQIPPMVIQTLVENAIKHGIAHLPEGGEIRIQASRTQDFLEIKVINTGQIHDSPFSTGIGLKNASQRLKLLSNSIQKIELENQPNNQVMARFRIPLQNQLIEISEMKEA